MQEKLLSVIMWMMLLLLKSQSIGAFLPIDNIPKPVEL